MAKNHEASSNENPQDHASRFDELRDVPFGGERSGAESVEKSPRREKLRGIVNRALERLNPKAIIGPRNEREIAKIDPNVERIMALRGEFHDMDEETLRGKTEEFRERIQNGESIDKLMPEAYAAMREATSRVLGMEHYQSQLRGAVALNQGRIAEMQTGEGKTITAALPAYLNALTGNGVHVITSNDYLARRDMEQMSKVYEYMGLTTGLVAPGMNKKDRKKAYAADITYGTNSQFGFDYLRDNLAKRPEDQVQRGHAYALVDEVDSVLLDEARTPLVIAGVERSPEQIAQTESENNAIEFMQFIVDQLGEPIYIDSQDKDTENHSEWDADFVVDKKHNSASLTEQGYKKLEETLGIKNLNDPENVDILHKVQNALQARAVMKKDRDYIVQEVTQKDGSTKKEVVLIDKNTSRALPGRRFNNGLHQAIEAKEGLEIGVEADMQASITVQNYYRMYDKLSGMTGTGLTETDEFRDVYGLDVVAIPPERGVTREDREDVCFRTEADKRRAILQQIQECQAKGQPMLIGVSSVAYSRKLSKFLEKNGIEHELLNASKSADEEARIIAQAGRKGAITIATNMAGRGTDISLGGNASYMAQEAIRGDCQSSDELAAVTSNVELSDPRLQQLRTRYQSELARYKAQTGQEKDEVKEAGGLFVLGAERNGSRRVDNQLRGRAGRQGDPGVSQFFTSLEDNILRVNGAASSSEQIRGAMGEKDQHGALPKIFTRIMDRAQGRSDSTRRDARMQEIQYDSAMREAREEVFRRRQEILEGANIDHLIASSIEDAVGSTVEKFTTNEATGNRKPSEIFDSVVSYLFGAELPAKPANLEQMSTNDFAEWLGQEVAKRLEETEGSDLDATRNDREARRIVLGALDQGWVNYLNSMNYEKQGIGLVAYAERDPVKEYQKLGAEAYGEMAADVRETIATQILRARSAKLAEQRRQRQRQASPLPAAA